MLSIIPFDWLPASTWEALGVWIEAVALIAIFFLDWQERREAREERRLQREAREDERKESEERRKAREDERREREELRQERQREKDDRQRADVMCIGVQVYARDATEESLCSSMYKQHANKQAGFVIETHVRNQLPEYLLRKADAFSDDIVDFVGPVGPVTIGPTARVRTINRKTVRELLLFKFPYRDYTVILSDLRTLNLGRSVVAWDESGKMISVRQN